MDDSAVRTCTKEIREEIIAAINSKVIVRIKSINIFNSFNGAYISKRINYIKIYNNT